MEVTLTTSTVSNSLRFPGQLDDFINGFYYNYNRYYINRLGIYNITEPYNFEGLLTLNSIGDGVLNPLYERPSYLMIANLFISHPQLISYFRYALSNPIYYYDPDSSFPVPILLWIGKKSYQCKECGEKFFFIYMHKYQAHEKVKGHPETDPNNCIRHCSWACSSARACGAFCILVGGYYHEFEAALHSGHIYWIDTREDINNNMGRDAPKSKPCDAYCDSQCKCKNK